MNTMKISLPSELTTFMDEQAVTRGYGTSSEYARELIRRERERQQLRESLLEGATSSPATLANGAYFHRLRERKRE